MPDGGDVGVIERCQQPGLALEAGHPFGIAYECVWKEFQRNLAVQVEVVGHVDFAHASAAKLFTDSIMAQRFSDHFPGTRCFSSSNQFRTMLIFGRGLAAVVCAVGFFIIRNRFPSGWMSHASNGHKET